MPQNQDPLPSHLRSSSFLDERAWTFVIGGIILVVAGLSYYVQQGARASSSTPVQQVTEAVTSMATGDEPVEQIFKQAGCVVCHTIPDISGAEGQVGSKLVLGRTTGARLADPNYRGKAVTVREYVAESILMPSLYVVPGYPDRVMPRWYGRKLSAAAVDKMAVYLERISNQAEPSSKPRN